MSQAERRSLGDVVTDCLPWWRWVHYFVLALTKLRSSAYYSVSLGTFVRALTKLRSSAYYSVSLGTFVGALTKLRLHGCMVYTERAETDSLWQQILVAPGMPAL